MALKRHPVFLYNGIMKRKITYLLKDYDNMMKKILSFTKDKTTEKEFIESKEETLLEIDKMIKKYDKILIEIESETEDEV